MLAHQYASAPITPAPTLSLLRLPDSHHSLYSAQLVLTVGRSEAAFIQQLDYWLQVYAHDPQKQFDGKTWIFNTAEQWAEQLGWEADAVRYVVRKLRERGIIRTEAKERREWRQRLWYTINYGTLASLGLYEQPKSQEAEQQAEEEPEKSSLKSYHTDLEILPNGVGNFTKCHYSEITTKENHQPTNAHTLKNGGGGELVRDEQTSADAELLEQAGIADAAHFADLAARNRSKYGPRYVADLIDYAQEQANDPAALIAYRITKGMPAGRRRSKTADPNKYRAGGKYAHLRAVRDQDDEPTTDGQEPTPQEPTAQAPQDDEPTTDGQEPTPATASPEPPRAWRLATAELAKKRPNIATMLAALRFLSVEITAEREIWQVATVNEAIRFYKRELERLINSYGRYVALEFNAEGSR